MKNYIRLVILFFLLAGSVRYASAEVRLAGIFADHMVLQREKPIQSGVGRTRARRSALVSPARLPKHRPRVMEPGRSHSNR